MLEFTVLLWIKYIAAVTFMDLRRKSGYAVGICKRDAALR